MYIQYSMLCVVGYKRRSGKRNKTKTTLLTTKNINIMVSFDLSSYTHLKVTHLCWILITTAVHIKRVKPVYYH